MDVMKMRFLAVPAVLFIASCAAPDEAAPAAGVAAEAFPDWRFDDAAPALRAASCPEGTANQAAQPLKMTVTPVAVGADGVLQARLPSGVALAGAWRLQSDDRNLGGLSGLAVVPGESRLLAASDAGGLVSIALVDGVPQADAMVLYLRAADGRFLSGKRENDAEGLVYRDGLALVSFERQFRIEAFAVEACGAAARAARVANLPGDLDGKPVGENAGPEALSLSPGGALTFGYEETTGEVSPLGVLGAGGEALWTGDLAANPPGFALVGLDTVVTSDGRAVELSLFRSFDAVRGVRSVLAWGPGSAEQLALSRPLQTDNFEGLAGEALPDGVIRVWIVSDDNFSEAQKTLLYAFDIATPAE